MSKKVKITDKRDGKSMELMVGALGSKVFEITKSVNDMNEAIRWCTFHKKGDVFNTDSFMLEIVGDK